MRDKDYILGFIGSAIVSLLLIADAWLVIYFEMQNIQFLKWLFILIPILGSLYFKDKSFVNMIYKALICIVLFSVALVAGMKIISVYFSFIRVQFLPDDLNYALQIIKNFFTADYGISEAVSGVSVYITDILIFILSNVFSMLIAAFCTYASQRRIKKKYKKRYKKSNK